MRFSISKQYQSSDPRTGDKILPVVEKQDSLSRMSASYLLHMRSSVFRLHCTWHHLYFLPLIRHRGYLIKKEKKSRLTDYLGERTSYKNYAKHSFPERPC